MLRSLLLFAILACMLSLTAARAGDTDRQFPELAKRAIMSPKDFPVVLMNGRERTLSPAAQIRNTDNLIQMPASLGSEKVVVYYTENQAGEINRIWILTPEEIRQTRPAKPILPRPAPTGPPLPQNQ